MSKVAKHVERPQVLEGEDPAKYKAGGDDRIFEYTELLKRLELNISECKKDQESLEISAKVLELAPDNYSIWNFRRHIISQLSLSSKDIWNLELKFVKGLLRKEPKSYFVINQWRWVLENMPDADWGYELSLIEELLNIDGRNFHCWDARRYITQISNIRSPKMEIEYTSEKINQDFSNYSAWHYRITKIYEAFPKAIERNERLKNDLGMVWNAIFTSPTDQCAWLYFRHIKSILNDEEKEQELSKIEELLEFEQENRYGLLAKLELSWDLKKTGIPYKETLEKIEKLDPQRKNYYKHLKTRFDSEY